MRTVLATVLCLILILLLVRDVHAGEVRDIELIDGSIITGEVLSLTRGVYTVRSGSLGTVRIEEAKVRSIRSRSAPDHVGTTETATSAANEARSLQDKMMSDQEIMTMIQSLQDNPAFQKLLEDPAVMKAVSSQDVPALMANPQFMRLLNDPAVRAIEKKISP